MSHSPKHPDDLIAALVVFSRKVLAQFAEPAPEIRNIIIRNFIARGVTTLVSIHSLAGLQRSGDCWTLFRSLTDRLFHLHWLGERDEFELFEQWSFIRQYEAQHRALSDPNIGMHRGHVARPTTEQQRRYRELKAKQIVWHRPDAAEVGRSLQMPFLFKYGYDFASTHVHPMANDGEDEFMIMCGSDEGPGLGQVVENAALIYTMILQEGLNRSSLLWARIVYDFIDAARNGIAGESSYRDILIKLETAGPEFQWSRQRA